MVVCSWEESGMLNAERLLETDITVQHVCESRCGTHLFAIGPPDTTADRVRS
jgi:hypothetical protein